MRLIDFNVAGSAIQALFSVPLLEKPCLKSAAIATPCPPPAIRIRTSNLAEICTDCVCLRSMRGIEAARPFLRRAVVETAIVWNRTEDDNFLSLGIDEKRHHWARGQFTVIHWWRLRFVIAWQAPKAAASRKLGTLPNARFRFVLHVHRSALVS